MRKKILAVILIVINVFILSSCGTDKGIDVPDFDFNGENISIVNDIAGDTTLDDTIRYASRVNDVAQSYYTKTDRSEYVMKNSDMMLVHTLTGKHNGASLYDTEGNVYLEDTFESTYVDPEGIYESEKSETEGRVNTIRLGEYYRECHIRDFSFNDNAKLDKTFHLYGDRLYAQFSLLSAEPLRDIIYFATSVEIRKDTVTGLVIKDSDGVHNSIDDVHTNNDIYMNNTVEYVAFDVKNAGVVGFIFPADKNYTVAIRELQNHYTLTVLLDAEKAFSINDINGEGGYENDYLTLGFRIYADKTHSFDKIDREAVLERNPLKNITVNGGNAEGKFLGYDSLSGAYLFSMKGTDFNTAYQNPDLHYSLPVTIANDSYDRNIYIRSNGDNGCLEAAALLDDTNTLVPVNVQVCKNFQGDGGEPFYSVKDLQYGDCIFPVSVKADEIIDITLLNLYQNWGKYPLKQLSSIEFHIPYYHLSTGTTESNCIAPYFVFDKDGWTLPDFRTASGNMWKDQPQFNSVGILKFMTYRDGKKDIYSEFVHSDIASVGQTYSDITNTFYSDDGTYKYSLRHVEFPQTDENRTYYTLNVEFLEDKTFNNFKKDFDLFYFDGRFVQFDKISYLDAENKSVTKDVDTSKKTRYYELGSDSPYWGFYDVTDEKTEELEKGFGANFAMIIKDSNITTDGKTADIPFVFRENSDKDISTGSLTLDAKNIAFKKGDTISIDMILLPWGTGTEENDNQVLAVREDSALSPVTVTVETGAVSDDTFIPVINCENNIAEFTVKGGRNNIPVRVNGFTELKCPEILKKTDNGWENLDVASSNGYDGYTVFYNDDGTYGFSFVYSSENPDISYTFRLEQN
ncbi:MAG: hypothetical protein IKM66_08360 [Clostridia bacterium]|nr:hypothetical protein [Clostridia bacterium]